VTLTSAETAQKSQAKERLMDDRTRLESHLSSEVEEFVAAINQDSEWTLYGREGNVTFEVTDEIPPDRSVIVRRVSDGKLFAIHHSVTVTEVDSLSSSG
jgi:predicted SnoaL-like aldol condensation-catalyzing enzyme